MSLTAPESARPPVLIVAGGNHFDLLVRLPRLPRPNDRLSAQQSVLAPGGMGGNVATAFARLGGRARFAGSFTDDDDGDALRRDMHAEGIDTTRASIRSSSTVSRGFILIGEHGDRAILGLPSQTKTLPRSSSRAPLPAITPSSSARKARYLRRPSEHPLPQELFHPPLDGFYCPAAFAPALIPQLLPTLPLFIDIETGHLDGLGHDEALAILRRATLVFGNQENLQTIPPRLGAKSLSELAGSVGTVIIETLGAAGCAVHAGDRTIAAQGFAVDAIDTTGAGDCFAGAFIFALFRGMPLHAAALFANAAAALSTRCLGSRSGMPGVNEVEQLLAERARDETMDDCVMDPVVTPQWWYIASRAGRRWRCAALPRQLPPDQTSRGSHPPVEISSAE